MKVDALKSNTTRNYAIDALRFIAICFVIYIHIFEINKGVVYSSGTSWKLIDILFGLARLAVPVFFAISGWFIFSKDRSEQISRLQKQVPRLLKILVVATIGSSIVLFIFDQLHILKEPLVYAPQITTLFNMFALGASPTIATLWFLVSLIIIELIFLFVSRKLKHDNWLMIPAVIFFTVSLIFGAYRNVVGLPELPFSITETWFIGFIWFSLGYFLAKFFKDNNTLLKRRSIRNFALVSAALYLYEYILHTSGAPFVFGPYNYIAIFLFTPFITAGILLVAARSNVTSPTIRGLAYLGKNYALGVFIIHLVVMQPINELFIRFGLLESEPLLKLVVVYSSVVIISFALTAAYYTVKASIQNKMLKIPLNQS